AGIRESGMEKAERGAACGGREGELHARRAGRKIVTAGHSPRDHNAMWWLELEVLSAHRHAVDINGELATWNGVQIGVLAHPGHHPFGLDQVREDHLGWCFDVDHH